MQELALLLSSIAGACTAAAAKKFPRTRAELTSLGANSHIKSQINSLIIEKEILTKTISRLYQQEMGLTKIQRDKLLLRYQHQLGVVLAKIEKLEAASKHPDLGPLGDGLITLMDQKLSQLDQRLFELSSKIAVTSVQASETKKHIEVSTEIVTEGKKEKQKKEFKPKEEKFEIEQVQESEPKADTKTITIESTSIKPRKTFEITTLTEIPSKPITFPLLEQKPLTQIEIDEFEEPEQSTKPEIVVAPKRESVSEIVIPQKQIVEQDPEQSKVMPYAQMKLLPQLPSFPQASQPEEKPQQSPTVTDDNVDEDDDADLDKIKSEILKTLSKLEEAEVE